MYLKCWKGGGAVKSLTRSHGQMAQGGWNSGGRGSSGYGIAAVGGRGLQKWAKSVNAIDCAPGSLNHYSINRIKKIIAFI